MSRIIDLNQENGIFEESVIALGNFDGLHMGHRKIVEKTREVAREKGVKSSILLFKQHTNEVFPHFPRFYISSLQDKIDILEELGVDIIFTIDFTLEFAQLNNEEFILGFLRDQLNAQSLVCGPDYTFGKKSKGSVKELYEYRDANLIDVYVESYVMDDDRKVSSTKLRELISSGRVDEISPFLGQNYKMRGRVVHGYKIGSKELGFPTANISLDFPYIMPDQGVYFTFVYHKGKKYLSLTSIGTNPTVTDKNEIKLEVYIIDFNKQIYGDELVLEFIEKTREQIKFDSKAELIDQMNKDLEYALNYKKSLQ